MLSKEEANALAVLLQRVDLKGAEVETYQHLMEKLKSIVLEEQKDG